MLPDVSWEELRSALRAIGVPQAAGEQLDPPELAEALNATACEIRARAHVIEAHGLAYSGWDEVDAPILRAARDRGWL